MFKLLYISVSNSDTHAKHFIYLNYWQLNYSYPILNAHLNLL
jgi:hypothetical protein